MAYACVGLTSLRTGVLPPARIKIALSFMYALVAGIRVSGI